MKKAARRRLELVSMLRMFVKDDDYPVMVEPLPQGGFLAVVINLPGCCSDGPTEEDAVRNARENTKAWIKEARRLNRAIPVPSKVSATGPNFVREEA